MYAQFFNLREMPFSITPDPAYLYLSPRHQEALGHLLYGTGQYGGFVQLTGEVGTGKTTVVRTLLEQKLDGVDVAMIHNPRQSELEFVQSICDELRVEYDRAGLTLKTLIDGLNAHLLRNHAAGRRTVLIIDEAQNLSPDVLEQVRLLTNLETAKQKLLRIMLVGQPELGDLLARPDLRQLASRITARYHLTPLEEDETAEYIRHRLGVAGTQEELFSPEAVAEVQRFTRGIPRLINIVCDRGLLGAYGRNERRVSRDLVRNAAQEALGDETALRLGERRRPRMSLFLDRRSGLGLPRLSLTWLEGGLMALACMIGGALAYQTLSPYLGGGTAVIVPAPIETKPGPQPTPTLTMEPAINTIPPANVVIPPVPATAAPTAATTTAAAPPAPTTIASKPQTASLDLLFEKSPQLPELVASLVRQWDAGIAVPRSGAACPTLRKQNLECYRTTGDLDDLRQMNRPAILTFTNPAGGTRYALLTRMDPKVMRFETAKGTVALSTDEAVKTWTGEMLLLWRRETREVQLQPGMRGPSIVWLRGRLIEMLGKRNEGSLSDRFDDSLKADAQQFQKARGLTADGTIGIRTRIALSDPVPGTPRLMDLP